MILADSKRIRENIIAVVKNESPLALIPALIDIVMGLATDSRCPPDLRMAFSSLLTGQAANLSAQVTAELADSAATDDQYRPSVIQQA